MNIMKGDSDLIEDDGFITIYPKEFQRGIIPLSSSEIPEHGSPQDRGSADAYYSRRFDPHYYPRGTGVGERIPMTKMTADEIAQYSYGFRNEDNRKDWN